MRQITHIILIFLMVVVAILPVWLIPQPQTPSCEQEPTPTPPLRRARILAVGDLMQHEEQLKSALQADSCTYDYTPCFKYVESFFREADISIVNLETTLSDSEPYSGYPTFKSPTALGVEIRRIGVDLAAMANNHCLDRGRRGVLNTIRILDSLAIERVGVYADSADYVKNAVKYIERGGIRFAFVNYTYGTNGIPLPKGVVVNQIDTVIMAQHLKSIPRSECDCVVALMHWGNEYERKPHPSQVRIKEFLHRHGVDLIVGSHPHVIQPYEVDSLGRITLYSLGNFISNQRTPPRDGGLMAQIDIEEVAVGEFNYHLKLIPVWVNLPKYEVLPHFVADTISLSADARMRYNRFMTDTRKYIPGI